MDRYLSFSLVLIFVLISIITGCTGSITVTQTVTQTRINTITTPWIQTTTDTVTVTQTQTQTTTSVLNLTEIVTVTKNPPVTFSGSGIMTTTPFVVNSSPWILQYSTESTGFLTIALQPYYDLLIVNNEKVVEGEVYQKVIEGYTGFPISFGITSYYVGDWTISVIETTD
ncbi:MAG: hypothetical protein JSV74_05600 [Dehalococcoidia bacterium]|nr:MAG: hypothetical protein JSV74_05600 [Dehalococcoidia bacterium]